MGDKVEILRNLQDDAHQNHFTLTIPQFALLAGFYDENLTFRIQSTTIPSSGSDKYQIHYKGDFIEKTLPKNNMTKEVPFTIRVDQQWKVYNFLKSWKNLVFNTYTGTKDTPDELVKVVAVISVEDADDNTIRSWNFEGSRLTSLGEIPLDYSTGDPITVDGVLSFDSMNDLL